MGRFLMHHNGWFFEWSTVVDAPVTYAMNREQLDEHLDLEAVERSREERVGRIERAINKGTSSRVDADAREVVGEYNRAGPNETTLSFKEVLLAIGVPEKDI